MTAALPTEEQDQIALIQWFDLWAPKPLRGRLVAIPNGGYRLGRTAARLKAQGVRAGFPDLFLPVSRQGFHGLLIELKRRVGGRTSTVQHDWQAFLTDSGYCVVQCAGFDAAAIGIAHYLGLPYAGHAIPPSRYRADDVHPR